MTERMIDDGVNDDGTETNDDGMETKKEMRYRTVYIQHFGQELLPGMYSMPVGVVPKLR